MVNSVLAAAIVNPSTPDLVGAFERGQAKSKKQRLNALSSKALQGDQEAFAELNQLDPQVGYALGETIRAGNAKDLEDFIRDARIGKQLLVSNPADFEQFAIQRIRRIEARGGDASQTYNVLQQVQSGDIQGAYQGLDAFTRSIDDAQKMTANQQEFMYWQQMPEGADKDAYGRQIGALPPKSQEQLQAEQQSRVDLENLKTDNKNSSEAIKTAIDRGAKLFDKIEVIDSTMRNYDQAIELLSSPDANTGKIQSYLPSVRDNAIKLDNVINRLGIDVIGSTTFGALSESELKFALDTAVPKDLGPAELKEWFVKKREGQMKLKAGLQEVAAFLSSGEHTLKDWIEYDKGAKTPQDEQIEAEKPVNNTEIKFLGFE